MGEWRLVIYSEFKTTLLNHLLTSNRASVINEWLWELLGFPPLKETEESEG
jgi:hypothetical protein